MGIPIGDLPAVRADLSSVVLVNLSADAVVMPIRPVGYVEIDSGGSGGRNSNGGGRNSGGGGGGSHGGEDVFGQLEELPHDLVAATAAAIERAVPADMAPLPFRGAAVRRAAAAAVPGAAPPRRAQELCAPAVRVAVVDMMVELVGGYQTLRYVEGARARFITLSPQKHRPFLTAMLSTQIWQLFREQCIGAGGGSGHGHHSREAQVQLFTECVEYSRIAGCAISAAGAGVDLVHESSNGSGGGGYGSGGSGGGSSEMDARADCLPGVGSRRGSAGVSVSCSSVLYPSEDVAEVLESRRCRHRCRRRCRKQKGPQRPRQQPIQSARRPEQRWRRRWQRGGGKPPHVFVDAVGGTWPVPEPQSTPCRRCGA
ncbi:unnamed protein product [Phaeothamnion confervicola]